MKVVGAHIQAPASRRDYEYYRVLGWPRDKSTLQVVDGKDVCARWRFDLCSDPHLPPNAWIHQK